MKKYIVIGIICYIVYIFAGPARKVQDANAKKGWDKIVTVNSKEILMDFYGSNKKSSNYAVVYTDKGAYTFNSLTQGMSLYGEMNQHCVYKIWTNPLNLTLEYAGEIVAIEHDDEQCPCKTYYPTDSLKF
jgi:hypothetical protein